MANWSPRELEILLLNVEKRLNIIDGKFTGAVGGVSKQAKDAAWEQVAAAVNSCSVAYRTVADCQKKYKNYKEQAREKSGLLKRPPTGGGPPVPPPTPAEEIFLRMFEGAPSLHGIDGGLETNEPFQQLTEAHTYARPPNQDQRVPVPQPGP